MTNAESHDSSDAVLADWLAAQRDGRRAECDALMDQHPECAAAVAEFARDYASVNERFAVLRGLLDPTPRSAAEVATLGSGDTAAQPLKVGSTFGDYELLSEIARGGMGVVYKSRQKSLNRVIALKMVLGQGRTATNDRERFLVEARAVARLNHPHIVPIYEVGEHKGQPYFTMEYFSGGSLRERIGDLQRDPRAAARLMITVARALEHAHRRGILHRDLKPSNVLLDERREPHVTDFGLAKRLDEESDLTQAGAIVGTPSYMAPEQASAQTDLSTAVDVYGLGAVLYELLTGRPPFKGGTPMETMIQAMSREPQRPRKLAPAIDADLETICLKCLEKDPLARYGSAEALADDLARWLDGQPIHARPVSTRERMMKWSRRQPLLAGALATVSAGAIGLLVLAGFLWQNAELRAQAVRNLGDAKTQLAQVDTQLQQAEAKKSAAEKLVDEQRQLADQQRALADKIGAQVKQLETAASAAESQLATARQEARRTTYAADMQLAHVAWQGDNISTAADLVNRYRTSAEQEDVRGFEWHYLDRQLHAARLSWRDTPEEKGALGTIVGMALSPDGKTLATAQVGSRLKLWNLADGKLLRTIETKKSDIQGLAFGNVTGVFFEDEGRKLVAVARKGFDMRQIDKLVAAAMAKKEKLNLAPLTEALEFQVCTLADNGPVRVEPFDAKRLATSLFPILAGGGLFMVDEGSMVMVSAIDRSHDGKLLALAGSESKVAGGDPAHPGRINGGRLIVWDLAAGKLLAQQSSPTPLTAVAFSQAGDAIAIGTSDGAVGVGQPDLAAPPRLMAGHSGYIYALQFTSDGRRLASGAMDGLVMLWDAESAKEVQRLRGHTTAVSRLALGADDQTLISGSMDGTVKAWDLARSRPLVELRGHEKAVNSLVFVDDGRQLMSLDHNRATKTWSLPAGKQVDATAPIKANTIMIAQLSPSGRWIALKDGINDFIVVYELASGKTTRLTWKGYVPFKPVFSPDEKHVAAACLEPGGLIVWNIETGAAAATLNLKGMSMGLAFSNDGKLVAAAQGNGIELWDWRAGKSHRVLESENSAATAVAFSADDRLIAAAKEDSVNIGQTRVCIWNLAADQLQTEFFGAGQQVRHLAFSPDGRRLATGGTTSGQRGMLKLWDTTSGREVFAAQLPPAQITALAWSPNSLQLAAGLTPFDITAAITGRSVPSDIYIWDASPTASEH